KAKFIAADIEEFEYQPGDLYTSIVFNEMLYDLKDPMRVIDLATKNVAPSGSIIISMYHDADVRSPMHSTIRAIWRDIDNSKIPTLDCVALTHIPRNRTWIVRVLKPGA